MYSRASYVVDAHLDRYRSAVVARDTARADDVAEADVDTRPPQILARDTAGQPADIVPPVYTYTPRSARFGGEKPGPAEESSTWIYVGIGLGVLAAGGLVIYFATHKTHKKGRRR